ncbi:MAG: glycosyltransferase [Clostridiales bacterium]|jgi:glycosyltransferase involved in cell wall biosynthesis|nr:glycosyltransferase [Clostridiales bacterium]
MGISVIMAVYNENPVKLRKAVDSILHQTYKDFEFIICDDASTNNTYEVLEEIAKSDKRIRLLRNLNNMKAGGARNECLKLVTGEYIAIMDSDDISHPMRLERQASFLKANKEYTFVGTKSEFFCDNINNTNGQYWFCKEPKKADFLMTLPFVHGSLMFRTDVLLGARGYSTDKKAIRAEDYELLMRLYANGYKGANIDETLYYICMDESTYKRRKYKYRFNECLVKYRGFKTMGLMPRALLFAIKPLIVGLIPRRILASMKRYYYKDKTKGEC